MPCNNGARKYEGAKTGIVSKIIMLFIFLSPVSITMCGGEGNSNNGSASYTLSGRITKSDGAGLNGVTVTATGFGSGGCSPAVRTTTTNANGFYSFSDSNPPAGDVNISPAYQGYTFSPPSITVTFNYASLPGQNFSAAPVPHVISGTVLTAGGNAFPGAAVKLDGASTVSTITDPSGRYSFAGLQNGTYSITPSAAGATFTPATRTVSIDYADVYGQDFTASNYLLSGRVTASSGSVLNRVTLLLNGTASASTLPDANGYYTFIVQPGPYTVTPSTEDSGYVFVPANRSLTVGTADASGQDFVMFSTTPVTLTATDITDSTAFLNGSFENPTGYTTTVWFEYGTTISYGSTSSHSIYTAPGSTLVSTNVSGLQGKTSYHYRMVVQNAAGTFYGNDESFGTYITPEVLASNLNAPCCIRLNSGNVYWLEIYDREVNKVPAGGGSIITLATSSIAGNSGSLAMDAAGLYWADYRTIWKQQIAGGPVTALVTGLSNIGNLSAHSTGLYFGTDNGIEKADLVSGGVSTVVSSNGNSLAFQGGLVLDDTHVYWVDSLKGEISESSLDGSVTAVLATGLSSPHAILLESGFLYWAETGAIKKMSASGGDVITIVTGVSPRQIAKDADYIYFTDYNAKINKVDLVNGTVSTIAVGQSQAYTSGPSEIAVDDANIYWIVEGNIYFPPLGQIRKAPKGQ